MIEVSDTMYKSEEEVQITLYGLKYTMILVVFWIDNFAQYFLGRGVYGGRGLPPQFSSCLCIF